MKCFNHPNVDAVGICKNCNKGLCKDCLTEVENGIACAATCVDEVVLLNSLINKNKQSFKTTSGAYMRNAYIYGGMGLVFIKYGFQREGLIGFLSIMGLLLLVAAGFSMNSAKKFKRG